jgi:hypothetical protein
MVHDVPGTVRGGADVGETFNTAVIPSLFRLCSLWA